jgi:hypothetical protein
MRSDVNFPEDIDWLWGRVVDIRASAMRSDVRKRSALPQKPLYCSVSQVADQHQIRWSFDTANSHRLTYGFRLHAKMLTVRPVRLVA